MIKLVRHGVFETNSSSCHSLSIAHSGALVGLTPNEDNEIVLTPGEFGWEVETFQDPLTKIAYCWQDTEHDSARREMLIEVVLEHTGASKLVMRQSNSRYFPDGYIDHESVGTSREAFVDKTTLKNFLFNSHSELIIDNDNH